MSLEEALVLRRSVREFERGSLSLGEVSQILWAAQGQTDPEGGRTVPSAGALYPLETTLLAGEVRDLAPGAYKYRPATHDLLLVVEGDQRRKLAAAALEQYWIAGAPAVVVLSAIYGRTTGKYGGRGKMYVHMEAGHAVQAVALQAVALGLGCVVVGAMEVERVRSLLRMVEPETPLCLIPLGRPR